MASKKASGRNVKEAERNTVAIKLRLSPEAAEDLKVFAEEWGLTYSQVVEKVLDIVATTRGT